MRPSSLLFYREKTRYNTNKGTYVQTNLYNMQFETTILSSIIFEPIKIEECLSLSLKAGDFYLPFYRELFEVVTELYEKNIVDDEIIKQKLGNRFDEKAMLQVLSANPVSNLAYYIDEVKKSSKLRYAQEISNKIKEVVQEEGDYNQVLKVMNDGLNNLEQNNNKLIKINSINTIEAKESEFIGKNWLPFPKRAVSLVTAGGGVGKSFLLLQAALRIIDENNSKVFMWLSEDPVELSKFRYEMIVNKVLKSNIEKYKNNLDIAGSDSETIHFLEEDRYKMNVSGMFYQFKAMLKKYDVIILDPLIAMFGGDENNNAHAKQFINLFSRWATVENKTIIFIHHGTKNSAQSRGASAFVDAVRLVYQVEVIKNKEEEQVEEHMRLITLAKDNNGAKKYLGDFQVKRQVFPKNSKMSISFEMSTI